MNRTSEAQLLDTVCNVITLACFNTNPEDAPKFDDKIFVDGQPVDVGKNAGDKQTDL